MANEIGVKSPKEVELITEIELVIDDVSAGEITPVEILAVLEAIKLRIFNEYLVINE